MSLGCDNYSGRLIRFVSYNILAPTYAKPHWFFVAPHTPPSILDWDNRSMAILTVLENLNADFLCLQELEHVDFFNQYMQRHGYSCLYMQRGGNKPDGCGIFYKHGFAELVMEDRIDYNDLVNGFVDKNKQDDLNDPLARLKRDCVGIIGVFKLQHPKNHVVIVANTHLYFNPRCADVKLEQAKYLLWRLERVKNMVSEQFGCVPSVILAGDFNSKPGDGVYQHLTSSTTTPLWSVHAVTGGEPPFTNCTHDFKGTLDYIFFSPSNCIRTVTVLKHPYSAYSSEVVDGLPNYYHPSDHLPVAADFEIISPNTFDGVNFNSMNTLV